VRLRGALTADLPLKVTSLGLSVFLWFLAAGEEPASALVPVEVTVRPPAGRTVMRTAGPVRALVTGPRRELLKLSTAPMRVVRILPDTTAADQVEVELTPGELELPRGVDVHVQDVEPRAVAVELDSTFQRVVPVRAVVRLPPETGHVLSAIAVVPGTVRLLGPREAIQHIDSVRTEPLEIAQADGPVEETLALDSSGFGRVRVLPAEVTVRVTIEAVGERTLTRVPVRLPSDLAATMRPERTTVEVRVRGPSARLDGLSRDSVPVVVDWSGPPGEGRAALRVLAPAGLEARPLPDSLSLIRRSADG
jgi:YbbR domain-containing protein